MFYGEELNDIHNIQLKILKEVVELCKKYDIKYFAIGGTALGTIRHRGFIPWDDDIDIGMTRENYNKFIKIAKTELPNNLFFQHFSTEEDTPFYFTKVRDKDTEFIEPYCSDLTINHGIFIDIFPYDNIPDNKILRNIHYIKIKFLNNLFISKTLVNINSNKNDFVSKFKRNFRKLLNFLLRNVDKNTIFNKLDKEVKRYNDIETKTVGFIAENEITKKEWINTLENRKFENIYVFVPRDYHWYLSSLYGDYMKVPKEENRVNHNPSKVKVNGVEYEY